MRNDMSVWLSLIEERKCENDGHGKEGRMERAMKEEREWIKNQWKIKRGMREWNGKRERKH